MSTPASQIPQPHPDATPLRFVTAASLFDGHDAAINIMRRLIQAQGAEVIHLGHNRSVEDVVRAALQEDADAIALSSYQGGHVEYFKYMVDMLKEHGASHIRVFGGGGGTITPEEIRELEAYGVERIYHPNDGMKMGLVEMIEDVVARASAARESRAARVALTVGAHLMGGTGNETAKASGESSALANAGESGGVGSPMRWAPTVDEITIGRALSAIEDGEHTDADLAKLRKHWQLAAGRTPVIGITGTGGAGKSSVTDELLNRFLSSFPAMRIAVVSVDPTRRRSGGALLGDRIRMNSLRSHRVYMRSMATRRQNVATNAVLKDCVAYLKSLDFDLVIVETAGIGQSDSEIVDLVDFPMYVMTSDYGAASQLEKIDMLDYAELIVLNKYDRRGAEDALRDVRKQWKRNRVAFNVKDEDIPVYPTIASQFNDPGISWMFANLCRLLRQKLGLSNRDAPPVGAHLMGDTGNGATKPSDTHATPQNAGQDASVGSPMRWAPTTAGRCDFQPQIDTTLKEPRATVLIPGARVRYLAEIAEQGRAINRRIEMEAETASRAQSYWESLRDLGDERLPEPLGLYPADALLPANQGSGASPALRGGALAADAGPDHGGSPVGAHLMGDTGNGTAKASDVPATLANAGQGEAVGSPMRWAPTEQDAPDRSLLTLRQRYNDAVQSLSSESLRNLREWPQRLKSITDEFTEYQVRNKAIRVENYRESLSHQKVPKIAAPTYKSWGELLTFLGKENLPGSYPYTGGVYPYRRTGEDPIRMFAGEGTPERTNRRFHYLSAGQPAARLSTAFDSVTLYGEDPAKRPDIYGKIGNSGVNIPTLDDMKKLYSGFDLCAPTTSVSMTINGPAPIILAMFMNTAIDQQVEKYLKADPQRWADAQRKIDAFFEGRDGSNRSRPRYHGDLPPGNDGLGLGLLGVTGEQLLDADTYAAIKAETLKTVRGTVQADILKEDQAQNTCIFSTEFALRMMGDIQQYFVDHQVRNFYSVSISGYHIAEAGANPISQLAFTLSNGFTIVEYYLARGMHIDDFAPNLSFFFSNGMDPEYTVIGRVARRIWARAMRERYQGNERSQMMKYHIQTSGRSLHAQEIQFNDIRTTLQALYALFDNCNSLHTNAYDEAITTPTEESVRRAVAIQMIINKELGLNFCENPWQGSFAVEYLTDLVEEAVYKEFEAISERGGVLGAMDTMYQRGKIQEESLYYEHRKHDGSLPLVGVNTFLPKGHAGEVATEIELIRSTEGEKAQQIANVAGWQANRNRLAPEGETATGHIAGAEESGSGLAEAVHDGHGLAYLQDTARRRGNVFAALVEAVKTHSLGQISHALYDVGGEYRRNM
ncbi:methylmalonyl-CoA mutase family protein [Pseudoxanthomonas kaohsiungensis]|uniref:Fused isobutyryl-CoA mutase n=1 Tax=Pseudoxanthomonas kaohsiungensis TaxID=283923 RepID=A0ABW3LWQ8_9GAMM|nr:methylmalonyl-CoA mutase family protein [Pseudoxanthomonas kaohsiungensis]KAF1705001.1 methylmalonyl-CoA mutase [Pseudoxanthomonas kaohsiungensis]